MNTKTSFLDRELIQDKTGGTVIFGRTDTAVIALMKHVSFLGAIGDYNLYLAQKLRTGCSLIHFLSMK